MCSSTPISFLIAGDHQVDRRANLVAPTPTDRVHALGCQGSGGFDAVVGSSVSTARRVPGGGLGRRVSRHGLACFVESRAAGERFSERPYRASDDPLGFAVPDTLRATNGLFYIGQYTPWYSEDLLGRYPVRVRFGSEFDFFGDVEHGVELSYVHDPVRYFSITR